MKKNYYIPFDFNSKDLITYTGYDVDDSDDQDDNGYVYLSHGGEIVDKNWRNSWGLFPILYKKNHEFQATLKYSGYCRGRSAARICFTDEDTGAKYEMFMTDFDDMIESNGMDGNKVIGTWTFVKRGCNYGVKLVSINT